MTDFTKPSDAELRARPTPIRYSVTQQDGTEPPFRNDYNDYRGLGCTWTW